MLLDVTSNRGPRGRSRPSERPPARMRGGKRPPRRERERSAGAAPGGANGAPHTPVLADELVQALDVRPGQTAVDCTFGGGGHARAVAQRLGPEGTLVAIDRDPAAERCFAELAGEVACSLRFLRSDYREVARDRTELRDDLRSGNYAAARAERQDLRNDYREVRHDGQDLARDWRDYDHDIR